MKRKIGVIVIILAAASVGAYFGLHKKETFIYNGFVEAQETDVPARISAIVKKYYVGEGGEVKKGDLIAELDSSDIELSYNLALSNYKRAQRLISVNSITQEAFDNIKYKYEEASLRLSWTKVYAPIDGQVIYKFYNDGEFAAMGSKIAAINNISKVYVNIYVSYNTLAKIKIGMKIKGFIPELNNKEFYGTIIFINDKAEFTPKNVLTRDERERLVYRVKTEFLNENSNLKSGMTLEIKLPQQDYEK
ncbi:MAG: efflux RND transporter periplasmic adaptor subunit [Elusimicrobiota bacterium]|jgi:HlyD family secretion protein|nr:efflux RND transporter periplasmic adaptor subunit [Elusimicrobiota bacterium]